MKTSAHYFSLTVAAALGGVALFKFANASFSAAFRGDVVIAVTAAGVILSFAIYDYSRRTRSLAVSAPVLRPSIPSVSISGPAPKTKAYGLPAPRTDRLAA